MTGLTLILMDASERTKGFEFSYFVTTTLLKRGARHIILATIKYI